MLDEQDLHCGVLCHNPIIIMLCLIILGITVYIKAVLGRYDAFPFSIRFWLQGSSTCVWLVSFTFSCSQMFRII